MLRSGTVANLSHLAVAIMAQLVVLVGGVPSAAGDPKPQVVHHVRQVVPNVQITTTTMPPTTTTEPPTTLPPETTTTTAPPPVAPAPQADPLGIAAAFQALGASTSEAETFVCIAWHESRFDPSAVNPSSGAGGALQFLPSTWANLGRPGLPEDAPLSDQIAAAWQLYRSQGWSPWAGSCV
jgi:hypothetical protein